MTPVEYKTIPGFPGYVAGDDGSIWSCWKQTRGEWVLTSERQRRLKEQIVKPTKAYPRNKPYRWVGLKVNGKPVIRCVHQLVLLAFVGPCPDGCESRHGGSDVSDNRLSNLCYGTKGENSADKHAQGTAPVGVKSGTAVADEAMASRVRQLKASGLTYKQVMNETGLKFGTVRAIVERRTWRHVA